MFDGRYPTQDVDAEYLNQLELFRSDAAKDAKRRAGQPVIEIHNTA